VRILFDHCVDRRLRRHLLTHNVSTTYEMGWATFKNGALLAAAEAAGFPVLLTVDQNIETQQNMSGRTIAILVLVARSNRIEDLISLVPDVLLALDALKPGQIVKVESVPPTPSASGTATP